MSNKNKLQRFAEISQLPNVFENFSFEDPHVTDLQGKRLDLQGQWNTQIFKNENPIVLELACGKGEYTIHLGERFSEKNFIGIDIKGARIWKGATFAHEQNMRNVAFLRTRIELIEKFFAKDEVSEIWITFPDPFLRESKSNRRLTSSPFLDRYLNILKPGAIVHLKTDDPTLYAFTLEVLETRGDYELIVHNNNVYKDRKPDLATDLLTFYEKQHLAAGKKITYTQFRKL